MCQLTYNIQIPEKNNTTEIYKRYLLKRLAKETNQKKKRPIKERPTKETNNRDL